VKHTLSPLLLLLLAPFAAGQMGSGYSTYANYGGDGAGGDLFVTAVVDGSISCNQVPPGYNCGVIRHTGEVWVTLNGVTTETVGSPVTPNSYISVADTNTVTNAVAGVDYAASATARIVCSVAGVVFQENPGGLLGTIGYRLSAYVYSGQSGGKCVWNKTCTGTCSQSEWLGSCTPDPFNIYYQCYDIVYTCSCGGATECVIPHAFCRKKSSPGTCT
jgi:hypothetical protein